MLSNQDSGAKSFDIKNLSIKEKISLVEDIWDEISNTQNYLGVSDEQKKELDSRLSKYKLNLNKSKEWSIVREEIKSKLWWLILLFNLMQPMISLKQQNGMIII